MLPFFSLPLQSPTLVPFHRSVTFAIPTSAEATTPATTITISTAMSAKPDRAPNSTGAKRSLTTHGSSGYFTPPTSPSFEKKNDPGVPLSLTTPPPSRSSTLRKPIPVSQATSSTLDSFVTAKLYDNPATSPTDEERSVPVPDNELPQLPELQHPCARHDDLIPNHSHNDDDNDDQCHPYQYQPQYQHQHQHRHQHRHQYSHRNPNERGEEEKQPEELYRQRRQRSYSPSSAPLSDAFSAPLDAHHEEEEEDKQEQEQEHEQESNGQPFSPPPISPTLRRPSLFSSASLRLRQKSVQRRGTHVDLSDLDTEEQAALEAEITARRAARRASRRKRTYADRDDDDDLDDSVTIGTRIAEGHQNYQLMLVSAYIQTMTCSDPGEKISTNNQRTGTIC